MNKKRLLIIIVVLSLICILAISLIHIFKGKKEDEKTDPTMKGDINLTQVKIVDEFWAAKQKQVICQSIEHSIKEVEAEGQIKNFLNASLKNSGKEYEDKYYGGSATDSDTYKLFEGMCYGLMIDPEADKDIIDCQKRIEEKVEEWIPLFTGSQDEEGYINTYYIIHEGRWQYFHAHELYVSGHFFEAAIAHYLYTKGEDTRLFDMAIKNADYIASLFGQDKWNQVPGHQEIELALVKLAQLCKSIGGDYEQKADVYAKLAEFFLDARGDRTNRTMDTKAPAFEARPGEYNQDHMAAADQREAVGHAVRALYMYTGMAKLDSWYDYDKYEEAIKGLWTDVTLRKSYVTGGVGSNPFNEGFAKAYSLAPENAYCESCASIALMFFDYEMNKLYEDSKYMENFEHVLYNSFLSSISIDGTKFFYRNPVITNENMEREDWYGCSCCPPNIVRFILSLQNYIYKVKADSIQIDLYLSNRGEFEVSGKKLLLDVSTDSSTTNIKVGLEEDKKFTLRIRKPKWAKGFEVLLNGKLVDHKLEDGYIIIERDFTDGDEISLNYRMTLEVFEVDKADTYNKGSCYLKYGPFVYALERLETENSFNLENLFFPKEVSIEYELEVDDDFADTPYKTLNRITKIILQGLSLSSMDGSNDVNVTLIPYYAFGNRGTSSMRVYINGEIMRGDMALEQYAYAEASHTFPLDSPSNLNDGINMAESRWTSYDDIVHIKPWVKYEFDNEVAITKTEIYWYDDGGGVRLPDDVIVEYWDSDLDEFVPVIVKQKLMKGKTSIITFEKVNTYEIRLVIDNRISNHAVGITEWMVFEDDELDMTDRIEAYAEASAVHLFPNGIDSFFNLNDGLNTPESRWTSYNGDDIILNPWAQYDFQVQVSISSTIISWYDDGGGVVRPDGASIFYWKDDEWKAVNVTSFDKDVFDWTISFEQISTTRLRLVIDNSVTNKAAGITEWRLFD